MRKSYRWHHKTDQKRKSNQSLHYRAVAQSCSRASKVDLSVQRRPAHPHPRVDLLRLAVAGQRLQPVDVVAIHQLWRSEGKEGYDLCRDLPAEVVGLARVICH